MPKNDDLTVEYPTKHKIQAQAALRDRLTHLKDCSIEWVSEHASELIGTGEKKIGLHELSTHSLELMAKGDGLDWIAAYIHGHWNSTDLLEFLFQMVLEDQLSLKASAGWRRAITSFYKKWTRVSLDQAFDFLKVHHDLSDRFFEVFLDQNFLLYGPGFYLNPHATLEQATQWQLQRCCEKLNLIATDHCLDAGSGWGGLGLYAAKYYGCKVTIATHSLQQEKTIRAKAYLLNIEHLVSCLDRTQVFNNNTYDKIGLLTPMNLIGHHYAPALFQQLSHVLKPQGLMIIQVLAHAKDPFSSLFECFMQQYFFDSFALCTLSELTHTLSASTSLKLLHLETMDDHVARSYADWHTCLQEGRDRLLDSGLTPTFLRLYDCYVALLYAGARSRSLQGAQFLLAAASYQGPEWLLSHAKSSYFPSPLVMKPATTHKKM